MSGQSVIHLLQGIGLMALWAVLYIIVRQRLSGRQALMHVAYGLLFGAGSVVCMLDPVQIRPGVFVDTRSVLPALAAPFGGPVAGFVAALIPSLYRLSLGGDGAWAGTLSLILPAVVGWVFTRWVNDQPAKITMLQLLGLSAVASGVATGTLLLIPDAGRAVQLFLQVGPPLFAVDMLGMMILGLFLITGKQWARSKEALARNEAVLRAVDDHSVDGQFISVPAENGSFRLIGINAKGLEILGLKREAVFGKTFEEYLPLEQARLLTERHREAASTGATLRWEDQTLLDGEIRDWEMTLVPVVGQPALPLFFYASRRDITWRKMAESALEISARTDGLTNLNNRRYAEERLAEEFNRSKRYDQPLSLLMFDLDHFKDINSRLGHDAGDQVLRRFAGILTAAARKTDMVARWGGEEFLMMLPNTKLEEALIVGRRICQTAREMTFDVEGGTVTFTVSAGAAAMGEQKGPSELVRDADAQLHRAKRLGRDKLMPSDQPALAEAI